MKILVLSDLHTEFAPYLPHPRAVEASDVVVLAGDIGKGTKALEWAKKELGPKPVVFVAGNHEFYGGHWDRTLGEMRQVAQQLGIHFLECDEVVLGDTRFIGCTLWTDFDVFGADARQLAMYRYEQGLNDCHKIRASGLYQAPGTVPTYGRLRASHVRARHQQSVDWLRAALVQETAARRTVVVTHHLPRVESISERYRYHSLTPGFASQLDRNLVAMADVWVHGHTHDSLDYVLDGTGCRVVCNPRGYPRKVGNENRSFADQLIVDLTAPAQAG